MVYTGLIPPSKLTKLERKNIYEVTTGIFINNIML